MSKIKRAALERVALCGPRGLWRCSAGALVVAVSVLGLVAASPAVSAGKPVLTIASPTDPRSLDPTATGNLLVAHLAYANIIRTNPDGSFSPELATSWHYLNAKGGSGGANKGFEFTLRHDARFSDGTPVTAQAVVAWLTYFSQSKSVNVGSMPPIKSIQAIGKWTVRIICKSPNPQFRLTLGYGNTGLWGAVASPDAVANPAKFNTETFGAGPYMVDPSQSLAGDHFTFVPNPYYYAKSTIKWSKIVVRIIPTGSSRLQALQAGQVDVAFGDAQTVSAARSSGLSVSVAPGLTPLFLINASGSRNGGAPLKDVRVRQALNYAIDRKAIAKALFGKDGTATDEPAVIDGFDPKYANYYAYNPAKAKALLAAAGYPNGFTIPDVYVFPAAFNPADLPVCQAIAQQLNAVGVNLSLHPTASSGEWAQGAGKAPMLDVPAGFDTVFRYYNLFWRPGSFLNLGVNDPVINHLIVAGSRSTTPEKYWRQITARVVTQAYFLPSVIAPTYWYSNNKVKGVAATLGRLPENLHAADWSPA